MKGIDLISEQPQILCGIHAEIRLGWVLNINQALNRTWVIIPIQFVQPFRDIRACKDHPGKADLPDLLVRNCSHPKYRLYLIGTPALSVEISTDAILS